MIVGPVRADEDVSPGQQEFAPAGSGRRIYKAVVEYDGTLYLGFQIQRTGRTVQGELERALTQVTQRSVRVIAAGRTDTGVHALGQVVHFSATWRREPSELQRALNAVLEDDVAIRELSVAPPGFHSRFSAVSREYRYTIQNGKVRSPLTRRLAHHVEQPLDDSAMNRACQCLVGQHDFMPFGWAPQGDNTVRNVFRASVSRNGEQVIFEIQGDAFLRRMVRRIAGNLILVGLGRLSEDGFRDLMSLRHRRTPAVDAPPQGLCLVRVNY